MIYDVHVHCGDGEPKQAVFLKSLAAAGIDGSILLGPAPACFRAIGFKGAGTVERLETVMAWCAGAPNLFPFHWIDPTEADARAQVEQAVRRGVAGFKVICNHFFPGDPAALPVYRAIADAGKPLLFHSGILWDGTNSSQYCRPAGFEALLDVPRLRFALAHISWPWVDECLAVYGKIEQARKRRPEACEMFIDMTPGTPPIYRREAVTKIFTIGYTVADNVLFGTDNGTPEYSAKWATEWLTRDNALYDELALPAETREKIYSRNFLRFVGK
jgi:predicted TIM-barrel fold metal-dependent hydrolase